MSTLSRHLLTAEEFATLPFGDMRYELVRGEIVTMPPAFEDHGETSSRLEILLGHYILMNKLGKTYTAETGFLVGRNPDTVRAPDFAFIQRSRLPSAVSVPRWVPVIPDLVVEVVSSGDRPAEIADKVTMWLDAGVRMALVVTPGARAIDIHRPGQPLLILRDGDTLDGGDVLPGFSASVSHLLG